MARQLVGKKKVAKYREATGLPVCTALVRGGTNHRVDLLLEEGKVVYYWPKTGEIREPIGQLTWDYEGWLRKNARRL